MVIEVTPRKYPYGYLRMLARRTKLSTVWLTKILNGDIKNEAVKEAADVLLAEMTAAKLHSERQAVIAKAHSLGLIVMMNN